jgi:hypothetical protein
MRSEQKIEGCTFQFAIENKEGSQSPLFPGLFHLFEHQYDAETHFWYGVADIECTHEDMEVVQQKGMGCEFMILVTLPNGRTGACSMLNAEHRSDLQSDFTRVAMVGGSTLERPDRLLNALMSGR